MLQHVVLWNYASVWKPVAQAGWEGRTAESRITVDPDAALPELLAFASLMRKARSGAAAAWRANADRLGTRAESRDASHPAREAAAAA